MRTNIELDDRLVRAAMKKAGVTTKRAAVDAALRAFVQPPPDYRKLLGLRDADPIAPGYDPKAHTPAAWVAAEPPQRRAAATAADARPEATAPRTCPKRRPAPSRGR